MTPTTVLKTPIAELRLLQLSEFRTAVVGLVEAGHRLVSMFAVPTPSGSSKTHRIHAVFIEGGRLTQVCTEVDCHDSLQSLTAQFPQFHCFEREIFEQHGLNFVGHPWLKPIRFEGANIKRMNDYSFYKLEGKEIHEVGVGPVHAGVIEPGHFRFMCYGETVFHLEIHLGYQHRGAEALLRKGPWKKIPPLIESIAGDSAVAYTLGFCRAWESLIDRPASPDVEAVRGIALELERVAMHLVGLSGLATDIAFLPGSSTYGRLRTSAINLSMRICGSRFGRSWFRPNELRFPLLAKHRDDIRKTVKQIQDDIAHINKLFQQSSTVQHRLHDIGTVPTELAAEIGLVGMAGRASGLKCDTRTELAGGIYKSVPMPLVTEPSGDCWARGLIRIHEIEQSLQWIQRVTDGLSDVESSMPSQFTPAANCTVLSLEEGWRGEVVHFIETDGSSNIRQYKVQDPSIRNWFGLAQAVKNNAIYDFPICNKSFDLSYCGNDL